MGTKHVAAHVPIKLYEKWQQEANEMDVPMSKYVQMKVQAGRKNFTREAVEPDETRAKLRKQRNELRDTLRKARKRINKLERQLSVTERSDIIDYVENHPGASRDDITQHILNTVNGRVTRLLTDMEGSELRVDEKGRFYAGNNGGNE